MVLVGPWKALRPADLARFEPESPRRSLCVGLLDRVTSALPRDEMAPDA